MSAPGGEPDPRGPLDPLDVRVPDDLSELAAEVEALRRERRRQARRARLVRLLLTRRWHRYGLSGPVVGLALLAVAVPATLLALLTPSLTGQPPARPLAHPSTRPGLVGGLLPDIDVQTPAGTLAIRDGLRPGVLALVPPRCGCDADVRSAVAQSLEFTRAVRLVVDGRQGEPAARQQAAELRTGPGDGTATSAVDPSGSLSNSYDASGVSLVLVAADGVVVDLVRNVRAGQRLEARLGALRP